MAKKAKKTARKARGKLVVSEEAAAQYGMRVELEEGERTLSPNEAAKILDVTGEAVKQWIYHRQLPAVKLSNGYWRIRIGDLEKFIQSRQSITSIQILVAGVDSKTEKLLSSAIESVNGVLLSASSVADSMLKAADNYPALFIIDIGSWKDGWKLIEKIRSSSHIRTAPIIVISKDGIEDDDLETALDYGIQACLSVPLELANVTTEIKRVLGK